MNEITSKKEKKREDERLMLKNRLSSKENEENEDNNIFGDVMNQNEMIKNSKIFKKGTLEGAE